MYRIIRKKILNAAVVQMEIEAPLVAAKAKAGQFIILRVDEEGERIPLTVAGTCSEEGTVKIIFQIAGATTYLLSQKREGEFLRDFSGPLGCAARTEGIQKVCLVAGGVGAAIALPVAEAFFRGKADVTAIVGFRSRELVILEEEFRAASDRTFFTTDDGSFGEKGSVTLPLARLLAGGERFDEIFAVGPLVMMKYVVETARPYQIPVTVSMNPIMIDGTGMCGGCRLSLLREGKKIMKFACVDGPDFDGYEVDFDEAIARNRMYAEFERKAYERTCNLFGRAEK